MKIILNHKFQNYYQIMEKIYNKKKMNNQFNNFKNLIKILFNL